MSTPKDALTRFTAERPLYDRLAAKMGSIALDAYRREGIIVLIHHRAKDVDSLVKKCVMKKKSYESIGDRAGIRILPTYPDEKDAAIRVLESIFVLSNQQEKVEEAEVDRFAYRGFHVDASLKSADAAGVDADLAGLSCEVQIHSPGESVWATINHDLSYKALTTLPREVERSLHRISAVLELVDKEMGTARKNILSGKDAAVARTLAACEKAFFRFVQREYRKEMSVEVLRALQPLAEATKFEELADTFVRENHETLASAFGRDVATFEDMFLGQPESVLVFFLLTKHAESECEKAWPFDGALFEGLKGAWSPPIEM